MVRNFMGSLILYVTAPGEEFAFAKSNAEVLGNIDFKDGELTLRIAEVLENLLLRSFKDNIKYRYKKLKNGLEFNTIHIQAFTSEPRLL